MQVNNALNKQSTSAISQ